MKKKTKTTLIIISILCGVLAILGLVIWYVIIPTQFVDFWLNVWQRLNDPLPIIGLSILTIAFFGWRVFASSSFGRKQIAKMREELAREKEERDSAKKERIEFENQVKELLDSKQEEIEHLKSIIKKLCEYTPNKKVKLLGEEVYGREEETDSSSTTKGL